MRQFSLSLLILGISLAGCSSSPSPIIPSIKGEYIIRYDAESLFKIEPMTEVKRTPYPWEEEQHCCYPKITKDFFRCRGSSLNPPVIFFKQEKEVLRNYDCGGPQKHSLPLRDQKEFIYPILIDLLNHVQNSTGKRVVITSGHCCPEHNTYLNSSPSNQYSKHMLGAEVDFYIQGMEEEPEKVVALLLQYYREQPKYSGLNEFTEFKRYEKVDPHAKIAPWFNKEIFIKILKKNEGRDFDNRHPYPYLSIQVRYDWDLKEKVTYSWEKVFHHYRRG